MVFYRTIDFGSSSLSSSPCVNHMESAFAGPMKRNTSAVVPWAGDVILLIVQKDLSSGSLAKSVGGQDTNI